MHPEALNKNLIMIKTEAEKLLLDIHKNSKITDFNKLIKEVKEKNIKKIFIKVTDQQKEP